MVDSHAHFKLAQPLSATGALPIPSAQELAHSEALTDLIRRDIHDAGGHVDFARFMQLALYAPGLGYYSAGLTKFGASGDFITAPELGALFARCLARQCRPLMQELGNADVLEVGAGSGALAADLLMELECLEQLPRTYYILELSADLRQRQAQRLAQQVPHLAARVQWLDTLPTPGFRGIVVANEVLDAMPVQRFCIKDGVAQRLDVAWDNGEFVWRSAPSETTLNRVLSARLDLGAVPDGYISEVNLQAEAWLRSMATVLEHGVILLVDYGYGRAEYYHPQRSAGTLLCHYRHRAHDNPLVLAGLQDITSHVEFTAMAEAATDAGLALLGYTSQAAFLAANGIAQLADTPQHPDPRRQIALMQEIKKLTLPQEMGELFKVMALGRGMATPMVGLTLQDWRGRL